MSDLELYPFQREGADFLSSRRKAYLADEMGLGKTPQATVAAARIPFGVYQPRTVVVAPAAVKVNWWREWQTWGGPGSPTIVSHTWLGAHGWDGANYLPDLLIVDEAHYWKTPSSNRTRAGIKLAASVHANGGRVWLLSGSPIPNDAREIYAVMRGLWPELLPRQPERPDLPLNQGQFLERYCTFTMTDYGPRIHGLTELGKTELPELIRRFMLRRTWRDVELQLPPLRVDLQYLPPHPEVEKAIRALADPDFDDPDHLATMRRLLGEFKAPAIASTLIEELRSGELESVVVMYQHRETGRMLREALSKVTPVQGFDGDTPPAERQRTIDDYQNGIGRAFIVQQQAGGVGITLTRSHELVLAEPAWSPAVNEQAIARIWRIGQDHPCRARIFAQPDTLDEQLMKRLVEKTAMQEELGMESSQ